MRTDFWRQGAAAILAAGLLASAVVAQEGASGEVKIEGEKPPAAAGEAPKPIIKPAKPVITDRDPFVNQATAGAVNSGTVSRVRPRPTGATNTVRPATPASNAARGNAPAVKGQAAQEEVEEVIVPAPEVTITGIVRSGGGHIAIVNSGSQSYMVTPGQKLGDYRVSAITDTAVTFTHTGKAFKVPIESFAATKK
jgi:hypothetical protein